MFKRFLTYITIFSAIVLASCSDDLDFVPVSSIGADGVVELTINVPEMTSSLSRAVDPEYQVNDVAVLIYPSHAGNVSPEQYEFVYLDNSLNTGKNKLEQINDTELRLSFQLKQSLRDVSDLEFCIIANKPDDCDLSDFTINRLATETVTSVGVSGDLTMVGFVTRQAVLNNTKCYLGRNAAKVTVSDKVPTGENVQFYPYALFGAASNSIVAAFCYNNNTSFTADAVAPESFPDNVTETYPVYFHRTKNNTPENSIGGDIFVIVKAQYEGTDYFYRLDFCNKDTAEDGSATYDYLEILSNHWYQFVITEVNAAGYSSPAEAALHPANGIRYEIHDHCPQSYNMISDGVRELGVSHTIEYTGAANEDGQWSDEKIYIKLFSKDASELPTAAALMSMITVEDPSWLEISNPVEETDADITGGNGPADDPNDVGKVYSVRLHFNQSAQIGTLENKVTVKWCGLEREVPVVWSRKFTGAELTSCKLTMNYGENHDIIDDYWSFLASTDDPATVSGINNLWGIQTQANNGKVRNEGFHFPVMYGQNGEYADYSYELTFDKDPRFQNVDATVTLTGDAAVTNVQYSVESTDPLKITLTRPARVGASDYDYATGKLNIRVKFNETGEQVTYSFDLYHTGFFHKDSQSHRLDMQDSGNYYYYEVVPVMVNGRNRYILDRNLGAMSAQDYIRDANGQTVQGNEAAAGGYYTVAKQLENQYKDPEMFDDTPDRVSPPGYRVPKKDFWDALRLSSSFHTESDGRVFPAYYVTSNPKIGNVYFPKAMLFSGGAINGESRSGFYWTGTAATGTEKDEIGRWLSMFTIAGSSTSFTNGCVYVESNPSLAYGASVRCINMVDDEQAVMRTYFNVTGATHVYLYTIEDGVPVGTTTWPGHAIGNYATMTDGRWFGFSYESSQFSPEQLYVIFNFVDQKGVIYTYSQDASGNTIMTTDKSPTACVGWKVIGDTNTAIVPESDYDTGEVVLNPATQTALSNWWRCGGRTSGTPYVYDYTQGTVNIPDSPYPTFYMLGDALSGGWDLNSPTVITTDTENIYVWEGFLNEGEMKATFTLDWAAPFYRPTVNQTAINAYGVVTNNAIGLWAQTNNDDDYKWRVTVPGRYKLTFNLETMTITARYLTVEWFNEEQPIEAGYRRIYLYNNRNWATPCLHYWTVENGSQVSTTDWPGVQMIKVPNSGDYLWYLDIPDSNNMMVLNNNGIDQTGDLPINSSSNYNVQSN
ncbi:MAG: starch-binding protein [Barnesiella sp.]|nr:starch-binding protein [Barnesiella sp.]